MRQQMVWAFILGMACFSVLASAATLIDAQNVLEQQRNEENDAPRTGVDSDAPTPVIVHFHLSGALTETPQPADPFGLMAMPTTSLKDLLEKLTKAREDESVAAVVLTFGPMAMGMAQIEELRRELLAFKAAGKRVYAHGGDMSMGIYAMLASVAQLSVVPTSVVWLTGLYAESLYVKGLLDKIGIEADILQMGDFKSAGETFTRTEPSEAAQENKDWLLDGLYESLTEMIAQSRGWSIPQVRAIIDEGPYSAQRALEAGLLDSVSHRDAFLADLREQTGPLATVDNRYGEKKPDEINLANPFAIFTILAEMLKPPVSRVHKDSVAIVYVDGVIQPGFSQPDPFGNAGGAFSGNIRRALENAADDDSVKAVVLRVDSPGGSAMASEIILRAVGKLQDKKPLVVSMGNVAASGGYYVSCSSEMIFADETTITASIGVVGGKLVTQGMWDKLGVNWVGRQRGKNADLLNTSSRFDERQRALVKQWMDEIYGVFKQHVVAGRGDKLQKPIEELAAGRVYTGKQAKELGLVDEMGGLAEALAYAAGQAAISDYQVRVIPAPTNLFEAAMAQMLGSPGDQERPTDISLSLPAQFLGASSPARRDLLSLLQQVDPIRVKALMQALRRIELIHTEGVIMMMPEEVVLR